MREILFRGKRVDNGEWIEGGYAENGGKTFIIVRTRYIPDTRDWDTVEYYENNPHYESALIEVVSEIVCQYTGLTDKNGRKIFEGDILRSDDNKIGQVQWFEEHSAFMIWNNTENKIHFLYDNNFSKIEVVGNIFDNPELIGEQP